MNHKFLELLIALSFTIFKGILLISVGLVIDGLGTWEVEKAEGESVPPAICEDKDYHLIDVVGPVFILSAYFTM